MAVAMAMAVIMASPFIPIAAVFMRCFCQLQLLQCVPGCCEWVGEVSGPLLWPCCKLLVCEQARPQRGLHRLSIHVLQQQQQQQQQWEKT